MKAGIILSAIIFVIFALFFWFNYASIDDITLTVDEKERITTNNDSYYLIFTEKEVFKNKDSIWFFKFNSSDVYAQLKAGETYSCRVNWYRFPFLSMYRNIIRCE